MDINISFIWGDCKSTLQFSASALLRAPQSSVPSLIIRRIRIPMMKFENIILMNMDLKVRTDGSILGTSNENCEWLNLETRRPS